jgi:hypothetical protein
MFQNLKKYLLPVFIVALAIYLIDQGVYWSKGHMPNDLQREIQNFGIYFLYSFVIGMGNIWVVAFLNKKFPWEEVPKLRAIYGIIGAIGISMILIVLLRIFTVMGIYGKSWAYFIENESPMTYIFSLIISLVIVLAFYAYYFFKEISKKAIKEQKVVAQTETAKYESLKSQLDPHFLFNSLNVLTSLIGENPKNAEQFTQKLSQVYRYVVEQKDKDLVPLAEELKFAEIYMDLLKMRFENALDYNLPQESYNPEFKVVPLSLQLLLENAVKHNVISDEQPLQIDISIQDNELSIENNFNAKKTLSRGTGVGLKNIVERYDLLTDRKPKVTQEKQFFRVQLPLLSQKSKIMNTQEYNESNAYYNAKKRVEKMKEFYINVVSYILVIPFLIFINYTTYWDFKWFYFPMFGWGIGLVFHYLDAFGRFPFLSKKWENEKIKKIMEEDQQARWH